MEKYRDLFLAAFSVLLLSVADYGVGTGSGVAMAQPSPGKSDTPAPLKITVGYTTTSATMLPVWVAAHQGIFRKQGLDAYVVRIRPGAPVSAALYSGEMDVAVAGAEYFMAARNKGSDHVFIGVGFPYLSGSLFAQPEIRHIKELRGKTVGISGFGASSHFSAIMALQHSGLDPNREVKFLAAGGQPEALAALQKNLIDAAMLYPPVTRQARQLGKVELLNVADLRIPYMSAALVSTERTIKTKHQVLDRFMASMAEALKVARTDKERSIAAMARFLEVKDHAALEESWVAYHDGFSKDMAITPEQIQTVLDQMAKKDPAIAKTKPSDYIDAQFVERLGRSGILNKLYP
jgi:NitT/TauT family transport system substrate-binding protein